MKTYPQTAIVVLHDPHTTQISALKFIPKEWTTSLGVRIVIMDPTSRDVHKQTSDLRILCDQSSTVAYNHQSAVVTFARPPKSQQAVYLASVAAERPIEFADFQRVKMWTRSEEILNTEGKLFVVKPEYGARGVGHLFFSGDLTTPTRVDTAIALDISGSGSATIASHDTTDDKPQSSVAPLLAAINGTSPVARCVFPTHGDRTSNEGYRVFTGGSRVWQEVVTDIRAEFRIITNEQGMPCYVLHRQLEAVPGVSECGRFSVQMARGNTAEMNTWLTASAGFSSTAIEQYVTERGLDVGELLYAACIGIKQLNLPLHAFDVFVTKRGTWGILEFSHEFGSESVPNHLLHTIGKSFVEAALGL